MLFYIEIFKCLKNRPRSPGQGCLKFIRVDRVLPEVKRARHFTYLEKAHGTASVCESLNDCKFDGVFAANAEDDFFEFQR